MPACKQSHHGNACMSENIFLKKMFEKMDSPTLLKEICML